MHDSAAPCCVEAGMVPGSCWARISAGALTRVGHDVMQSQQLNTRTETPSLEWAGTQGTSSSMKAHLLNDGRHAKTGKV